MLWFATIGCCPGCFAVLLGPAAIEERITRSYKPVRVRVIDGETRQPLPHATVSIGYGGWGGMKPPHELFVTDTSGEAMIRIARDRAPGVRASAEGYQANAYRDGPIGADPPDELAIFLYRLPAPYHVLEFPPGARGVFRFGVTNPGRLREPPESDAGWRPGQRAFVTRLESADIVHMKSLPAMGQQENDYDSIRAARFADGSSLPLWFRREFQLPPDGETGAAPTGDDALACWQIGVSGQIVVYVGTRRDANSAQAALQREWEGSNLLRGYWLPPLPDSDEGGN